MRKNVWVTFITFISLTFGYPLISYSDIITKDGLKIQFFRQGEKKSVHKNDLLSSDGISSSSGFLLDRIVFTNVKGDYHEISVKIFDCKNILVMSKDRINVWDRKKGHTFNLYPWLDDTPQYPGDDLENILGSNGLGVYRIIITNKNTQEKLIELSYTVYEEIGD